MPEVSTAIGGLALILIVLVAIALYVIAPLMLYFIYARVGETNELLRYLANREQPVDPSARPGAIDQATAGQAAIDPPTFRSA